MPVAAAPLWQFAQLPATTVRWSKKAGFHAFVRWQASQDAVVAGWLPDLPLAVAPLWQVAHVPGVTTPCEKEAGSQAEVRWQLSQLPCVAMCSAGFAVRAKRLPGWWQLAQSRGVPRKRPWTWHDSQRACWCAPVSGKPVRT